MSNYHVNLVDRVQLTDIPSTRWLACKAVLRALAEHANQDEEDIAWPGLELLMIETGASESVITRSTKLLADHEWIAKKRRGNSSNLYRLNVTKLKQHQVQRPSPGAANMSEHLSGLEFPGEETSPITQSPSGRSTARGRAQRQQRCVQATRRSDESDSSDRRERPSTSTSPTRQSDDRTTREPEGNPHPTPARAHEREVHAGEQKRVATRGMDGEPSNSNPTSSEDKSAEQSAIRLLQSLPLPPGKAKYEPSRRRGDPAVSAVIEAREVLTDAEITRVLSYGLDGAETPGAVIRTHRVPELRATVQKRKEDADRQVYANELPALWCTHCRGTHVAVQTPDGQRARLRCSDECSAPREIPPWVWQHITDIASTPSPRESSEVREFLPAREAHENRPRFERPSQRGEDPGAVVAARRRERQLHRYAQKFGVYADAA